MYMLNTTFAPPSDRTKFAADCEIARRYHEDQGATDILLSEYLSGMAVGAFGWSLRFATLDAVADYMQGAVALMSNPTGDAGEVRSRHQVVSRSICRVLNDSGSPTGPCAWVSLVAVDKPVPLDENKYALDNFVANGAKGATTVQVIDGEFVGGYFTALYGDTFDQIAAASAAGLSDSRVNEAMQDVGAKIVNRVLFTAS